MAFYNAFRLRYSMTIVGYSKENKNKYSKKIDKEKILQQLSEEKSTN